MTDKKERKLTEQQEAFLGYLMDEAEGDIRSALRLAGYAPTTSQYHIIKTLGDEMVSVAMKTLALKAPKAAFKLGDALDNPVRDGQNTIIKAATEILNRVGAVAPKEDVNLRIPQGGLFIMPAKGYKQIEPEEEDTEDGE